MQEQILSVALLVLVVIVLVVAIIVQAQNNAKTQENIAREGIRAQEKAFPSEVIGLVETLLQFGGGIAARTPSTADDAGYQLIANLLGYDVVKNADGTITLKPRDKPGVPPPISVG